MKRASSFPHRLGLMSAALLASAPLLARQPLQDAYAPAADPAWRADASSYDGGTYDTAEVLRAEPLIRTVRTVEPQQECRREVRYVRTAERRAGGPDSGAATLVGGVLGAVLGHQIGQRESRGVGTVAGALIGGAIGHELARDPGRDGLAADAREDDVRPVEAELCQTHSVARYEERVDGYRVTYRYNGHIFSTQLPRDPGGTLRVRVNVEPVG